MSRALGEAVRALVTPLPNEDRRALPLSACLSGLQPESVARGPPDVARLGGCLTLCRRLRKLDLMRTSLAALPEGIGGCVALKALYLNGCTSLATCR